MVLDIARVGVMVIRIWTEPADGSLRARITATLDVSRNEESTQGAASTDEITAAVTSWIEEFTGDADVTLP